MNVQKWTAQPILIPMAKKIGGASTRWRKICSECMIECHLFNEEIVATKPVL